MYSINNINFSKKDIANIDPQTQIIIQSFIYLFNKIENKLDKVYNDIYISIISKLFFNLFTIRPSYLIFELKIKSKDFETIIPKNYILSILDKDEDILYKSIKDSYIHDINVVKSKYILSSELNKNYLDFSSAIEILFEYQNYNYSDSIVNQIDLFITNKYLINKILWSIELSKKRVFAIIDNNIQEIGYVYIHTDIDCIAFDQEHTTTSYIQSNFLLEKYSKYISIHFYNNEIFRKIKSNSIYIETSKYFTYQDFTINNVLILNNILIKNSDTFSVKGMHFEHLLTYQSKHDHRFIKIIQMKAINNVTSQTKEIVSTDFVKLPNNINLEPYLYCSKSINSNIVSLSNKKDLNQKEINQILEYIIYAISYVIQDIQDININSITDRESYTSNKFNILLGPTNTYEISNKLVAIHPLLYLGNIDINIKNLFNKIEKIIWIISYQCKKEFLISEFIENIEIQRDYEDIMISEETKKVITNIVIYKIIIISKSDDIYEIPFMLLCTIERIIKESLSIHTKIKTFIKNKNNNTLYLKYL